MSKHFSRVFNYCNRSEIRALPGLRQFPLEGQAAYKKEQAAKGGLITAGVFPDLKSEITLDYTRLVDLSNTGLLRQVLWVHYKSISTSF